MNRAESTIDSFSLGSSMQGLVTEGMFDDELEVTPLKNTRTMSFDGSPESKERSLSMNTSDPEEMPKN